MTVFYNDVITNIIKAHFSTMIQSYSFAKFGRITDYDPTKHLVKVSYWNYETEEFDMQSNWLAYLTQINGRGDDSEAGAGDLWGHQYGPNMNEQVMVVPYNGDHNNGIVIGSIYTNSRPPPTQDEKFTLSGEFFWMHKSGTYLKFFNNGDVNLYVTGDFNIHVDGDINAHALHDVRISADRTMTLAANSIMLRADSEVISNAPATNTTEILSAGNGATGTFTTGTGQTITVLDGIITSIF